MRTSWVLLAAAMVSLAACGIPVTREMLAKSESEALAAAASLGYPAPALGRRRRHFKPRTVSGPQRLPNCPAACAAIVDSQAGPRDPFGRSCRALDVAEAATAAETRPTGDIP